MQMIAIASSARAAPGGARACDARRPSALHPPAPFNHRQISAASFVGSADARAGRRATSSSARARVGTQRGNLIGGAGAGASPRGARLVLAAAGDRVPVGDLKRALVNAGVDTSDCFERADLERKYALLTDAQKANTAEPAASSAAANFPQQRQRSIGRPRKRGVDELRKWAARQQRWSRRRQETKT